MLQFSERLGFVRVKKIVFHIYALGSGEMYQIKTENTLV